MPAATIAMTPSGFGLFSQLRTPPAGLEAAPSAKPEALSNPGSRPTRPPTERRLLIEGLSGSSKVPSFWRQSRNGVGRLCAPLDDGLDEHGGRASEEGQRHARGRLPNTLFPVREQGYPADEREEDCPSSAAGYQPGGRQEQEHGVVVAQRRGQQLAADDRDLEAC